MKVLVIGSGGREHALAWALARSTSVTEVQVAPGNGGTHWEAAAGRAPCRSVNPDDLEAYCREFELVVVGPEAPLADGLVDRLGEVTVFGPTQAAARIESSKSFAKEVMARAQVPTGRAEVFTDKQAALDALDTFGSPYVIKADGLFAGKGVGVFDERSQAVDFLQELDSERILIEEYLEGPELSVLAFCDGEDFGLMPCARDHKRLEDGDLGPNTGGMGAFSPVPEIGQALLNEIEEKVFRPTLAAMDCPYVGVLYAGLKLTPNGPRVLEFNCRFGDPETQVILPQFDGDLALLMKSCAQGNLDRSQLRWKKLFCAGVVMASGGYPGSYQKGFVIEGLQQEGLIFHAGTARRNEETVTAGGRVLAAVGQGETLEVALERAYQLVEGLRFEGAVYRKDIGRILQAGVRPA